VNKIPPNFNTLFVTSLEIIPLLKGLIARSLYKSFGINGLTKNLLAIFTSQFHLAI